MSNGTKEATPVLKICAVSHHSKKEIGRCFKLICQAANPAMNTVSTIDFMSRYCTNLGLPLAVQFSLPGLKPRGVISNDEWYYSWVDKWWIQDKGAWLIGGACLVTPSVVAEDNGFYAYFSAVDFLQFLVVLSSERSFSPSISMIHISSSLDTLTVLGSHKGDVIPLANDSSLIHLTLHSSSSQQQSLALSSVFSIEPNLEFFQFDDTLP
uniref:Uncharacterized protein n=1 Tax=Amphimedon queenslandica TaxID=400682 RepID=A0A1X7UB99_AMPQE